MPSGQTFDAATLVVLVKSAWSDPWVEVPYLRPLRATLAVSPAVGTAEFSYLYGDIKREDVSVFAQADPLSDLKGQLVQITSDSVAVWTGVIAEELVSPHEPGAGPPVTPAGDQVLLAYGLEHLLDRSPLLASVSIVSGSPQVVDAVPSFNVLGAAGAGLAGEGLFGRGNRSLVRSANPRTAVDAYAFLPSGFAWSVRDVAEYALAWGADSGVPFVLGGQDAALGLIVSPSFNSDGMTARQVLNRVIDRRRGLGWTVRVQSDGEGGFSPVVHVFSVLESDLVSGLVTVPANEEPTALSLDGTFNRLSVGLKFEALRRYDWVVVRGERVKSCFSASFTDGTLEAGWSASDEAAYASATERERVEDHRSPVFGVFRVPAGWGYNAGDGMGGPGGTASPGVKNDGELDPLDPAPTRHWGVAPLRSLPIRDLDSSAVGGGVEYRPPIIAVKEPSSGKYRLVNQANQFEPALAHVEVLEDGLGVRLRHTGVPHLVALNHFDHTASGGDEPLLDYETMVVSIAVETDARLQVSEDLRASGSGTTPSGRVLVVDVPGAELWWITPGTVVGIEDGVLQHYGGEDSVGSVIGVVRDDGDQLRAVAAFARAWYGRDRQAAGVTLQQLVTAYQPGVLLTVTTGSFARETIGTPVTAKTYDFLRQTTTLQSGFEELDFSGL